MEEKRKRPSPAPPRASWVGGLWSLSLILIFQKTLTRQLVPWKHLVGKTETTSDFRPGAGGGQEVGHLPSGMSSLGSVPLAL